MSEAAPRWVLHKGMWLAYIGERFTSELSAVCQSCPRLLSHLFCLNWVPLLSALLSGMICPVPLLPWAGNATSSVLSPRGGQCCHVHLSLGLQHCSWTWGLCVTPVPRVPGSASLLKCLGCNYIYTYTHTPPHADTYIPTDTPTDIHTHMHKSSHIYTLTSENNRGCKLVVLSIERKDHFCHSLSTLLP